MTAERNPVAKALELVSWFADHADGNWGPRQIARELDTPPATTHRTLAALEAASFVTRDATGSYTAGPELHRIAQILAPSLSPVKLAHPYLKQLADHCEETVMLGRFDYDTRRMTFVDMIESTYPLRYIVALNDPMTVHSGATGLAMLAYLTNAERAAVYADGLQPVTPRTLTRRAELEARVTEIKARGYSITHGERIVGSVGMAAPVFDCADKLFGNVCVTIPEARFTDETEATITPLLLHAATEITRVFHDSGFATQRGQR